MRSISEALTVYETDLDCTQVAVRAEVPVKFIRYPDGQISAEFEHAPPVHVTICRSINSFEALQEVLAVVSALGAEFTTVRLISPYILGGRADRRFSEYGCHYLRDVIGMILNASDISRIYTLDPHSAKTLLHLSKCIELPMTALYAWYRAQVLPDIVVAPDDGAKARIRLFAALCGCEQLLCTKKRDLATGAITGRHVPDMDLKGKRVLILDDLCDGGATFIELGKILREREPAYLALGVTHGIFSKGWGVLAPTFDQIFCTNSFKQFYPEECVWPTDRPSFLQQYTVQPIGA